MSSHSRLASDRRLEGLADAEAKARISLSAAPRRTLAIVSSTLSVISGARHALQAVPYGLSGLRLDWCGGWLLAWHLEMALRCDGQCLIPALDRADIIRTCHGDHRQAERELVYRDVRLWCPGQAEMRGDGGGQECHARAPSAPPIAVE